jgi:mRNA interferase RelE/StbE
MTWTIVVAKAAQKQLRKIPARDRDKIAAAIRAMPADPFQGDIVKLEGEEDRYRRRIGSYRVSFRPTSRAERWASARLSAALQLHIDRA